MAGSRARRLRRHNHNQGQQAPKAQLQESTTYSELLATTIPANSNQNADKVAKTLGIVQNVPSSSTRPAQDIAQDEADDGNDGDLATQLKSKSFLSPTISKLAADLGSGTALYHAAINPNTNQGAIKMAAQSKEVEANAKGVPQTEADDDVAKGNKTDGKKPETTAGTVPASLNTNCAVTIWDLPNGVTEPMIIEAISQHKPIGKIYACDVYVIPGPNNVPPAMPVASVRFMQPESATRLVLIGNRADQGIHVKGKRAKITLAHRPQPAYLKEPASRVVFFRGPRSIVNPIALRKLWGFKEQTEKLIIGKVVKGVCEIEWRFCSYAYNAEPAFCVFENLYGKREDCSVRYGIDPCA